MRCQAWHGGESPLSVAVSLGLVMPLSLSIVTVNVTRIPSVENRRIFAPYIAVWPAVGPYHPVWVGRVIVERAVVVAEQGCLAGF